MLRIKINQKPEMRLSCNQCKCIFEFEEKDLRKNIDCEDKKPSKLYLYVKCPICKNYIEAWITEEERINQINNSIKLLYYDNLRKHFDKLIDDVLGNNYYNEGCDVYKADELSCRDLKYSLKNKKDVDYDTTS